MSLYDDLDSIELEVKEEIYIKNKLTNFQTLINELSKCSKAEQVLGFLKVELTSLNRPSYVHRIYGRYRVLSSERDVRLLFRWRDDNGKARKNN